MIARLWHGWTAPEDADDYERLLREELFPRFAEEVGDGYEGYRLLRREPAGEGDLVEFLTVIHFDSWDAVRRFAGEEYRQAHVPPAAKELLARAEDEATHYELRAEG